MNIKKIGHCCLVIKIPSMTDSKKTLTILTDPGSFTTEQDELTGVDIVLITHEHQDHFHIESVKKILANNPNAVIITNATVGAKLDGESIAWERVGDKEKNDAHGTLIEGYGHRHAVIYEEWGETENTGYMIASVLFYPGDSFTNPGRGVEILALPVAGPWMKLSEALDYAATIKPRIAFPVHDAIYNPSTTGFLYKMLEMILTKKGVMFATLMAGDEKDL